MSSRAVLRLLMLACLGVGDPSRAQVPESATDPNGVAIPYRFQHLAHSTKLEDVGGTAYLRAFDPFLLYQFGRDLARRQFTLKQGVYGRPAELSVPLYVGAAVHGASAADARFSRDHASSCGTCHSMPFGEPGSGQTIPSTSGAGRNTTHFYGAGLVEMLGEQVRREILDRYDANRNGLIERAEVRRPSPVRIAPAPGAPVIDYGDLSPDSSGTPRLNGVFRIWYVDAEGKVLPQASGLKDPQVAAFGLAMQPFGWGRGQQRLANGLRIPQGGEASTLREFYAVAADVHMGLQAHDPTQQPSGPGGLARRSLNGAQQFDFGGSVDLGRKRTATGLSLDDPDGDGHRNELTEGDLDAVEFYLLHAPPPAVRASATSEQGRRVLAKVGCTRCHVEGWELPARDEARGFTGDRRLFHLETRSEVGADGVSRLSGRLVRLEQRTPEGASTPAYGAARVERVYSDFKHWDIGPRFHERRFDGSLQREHRTAPLWGVGSTAPYGHAGQFSSLEEVIAAHGGAAARERKRYLALKRPERELLLAYLESLVLYPTDAIPADIDGDGQLAQAFQVAGKNVGPERFDPRFLFATPPRFRVLYRATGPGGEPFPLMFVKNIHDTYRLALPWLRDSDGDSFPDVLGPARADAPPKAPHAHDDP